MHKVWAPPQHCQKWKANQSLCRLLFQPHCRLVQGYLMSQSTIMVKALSSCNTSFGHQRECQWTNLIFQDPVIETSQTDGFCALKKKKCFLLTHYWGNFPLVIVVEVGWVIGWSLASSSHESKTSGIQVSTQKRLCCMLTLVLSV